MGRLAHDWGWRNAFVSRITRLIHRDRNHACIIFWSLGNEAGRGRNLTEARHLVKELDPSRPICYESGGAIVEGNGRTELTDVICTMYPNIPRTLRLATRKDEDRPVILCEYSHAMGNSNGNLHMYWEEFWSEDTPRLQGGFIWDMIDQGLRVPDTTNGEGTYFAYGGDFGDDVNDAQFCINGMFSPDREPHPAVAEIKFLQQPVVFSPLAGSSSDATPLLVVVTGTPTLPPILTLLKASVALKVTNRYVFRDLSHLAWAWELTSDRSDKPIRSTSFELADKEDAGRVVLKLDSIITRVQELEFTRPEQGNKYFLNLRGYLRSDASWADKNTVLVTQQFPVTFVFEESIVRKPERPLTRPAKLEALEDETSVQVYRDTDGGTMPLVIFDKQSGGMISFSPHGSNMLTQPLLPHFTRASTDNDKGGTYHP